MESAARLNLLVLHTRDLHACRDFYAGLGLRFAREQHGSGPAHYAAVLADGCVLELYPARESGPSHPLRIGLAVPREVLDARDLTPGAAPLREPDGRAVAVTAV
jgi:catechol 2,3-dioxygenase-like lactoylglutathione lyase family enzyme